MKLEAASASVGQRGARLSERRPAVAASKGVHDPFKAASPRTLSEPEFFWDVEQGSDEWHELRLGIPTAGSFSIIMANGRDGGESETRARYLYRKAYEVMTRKPTDRGYINDDMRRGLQMEPLAADHYSRTKLIECKRVGFVRRALPSGRYVGASPDYFIGDTTRVLEIKCPRGEILLELADNPKFPTRYRAQCQGLLWVTGAEEIVLTNYNADLELAVEFTLKRDEMYIQQISHSVETFDWELHKIVERRRSK